MLRIKPIMVSKFTFLKQLPGKGIRVRRCYVVDISNTHNDGLELVAAMNLYRMSMMEVIRPK